MMSTSIQTRCIDPSQRELWDAYVDSNSLSIAWQRYEWHDILNRHYPHVFSPLAAFDGKTIRGVLPLYRLENSRTYISVPFAVAGGIVSDSPEIERSLLDSAVALLNREGNSSLILKQYKHKIAGDLRCDGAYFNRELTISPDLDALWNGIAPQNKQMISDARSAGFSLEYPSRNSKEFYSILLADQHNQGIPCVSVRWVEDLVHSSMYTCALVRFKGKAIAGTLAKTFKTTVSFPFTALKKNNDLCVMAAYWLYWELIGYFAKKGITIVHSGRVPANEAVPKYRLGWGGTKYAYYYQYFPNTATLTESSRKRGLKRTFFKMAWRMLPLPLAAKFGQRIVRKFP